MGKNSDYYRNETRKLKEKTYKLKENLPLYVHPFVDECLLKYRPRTAYSYIYDLVVFYRYLHDKNPLCRELKINEIPVEVIQNLNYIDINEFQNYLAGDFSKNGEKTKAIARKLASLGNFFEYMIAREWTETNPIDRAIRKKKERHDEISRLNPGQVHQLLDTVERVDTETEHAKKIRLLTAKRDYAILVLLLYTGIRVSECAGLDMNDVNFCTGTITILRKRGWESDVYMRENVIEALEDYIVNERPCLLNGCNDTDALFISLKRKRLSVRSIQDMLKKYGDISKIYKNKSLSPHELRRTFGTNLYKKSKDIRLVADTLGQEDINTTIQNYAAIEEEHRMEATKYDLY